MPLKLIPLPYAEDALAPTLSAETLRTHHGKHHKTYVKKTNEAIAGTRLDGLPLEQIVAAAQAQGDKELCHNASQAWNHGFYWHSLAPTAQRPSAALAGAIDRTFGSQARLIAELAARGEKHFASGWVWLVADGDALAVEETHDGDGFATGSKRPLLTIDLWEHAYYLDHRNERPKYLKGVTGKLLAWDFASRNYAAGETWRYAG